MGFFKLGPGLRDNRHNFQYTTRSPELPRPPGEWKRRSQKFGRFSVLAAITASTSLVRTDHRIQAPRRSCRALIRSQAKSPITPSPSRNGPVLPSPCQHSHTATVTKDAVHHAPVTSTDAATAWCSGARYTKSFTRVGGGRSFEDRRILVCWRCGCVVSICLVSRIDSKLINISRQLRSRPAIQQRNRRKPSGVCVSLLARTGGIAKGDILLFLLFWPTSRSKRRFKAEHCSRFCLPVSISKWSAAIKTVSQGLEFGCCFH